MSLRLITDKMFYVYVFIDGGQISTCRNNLTHQPDGEDTGEYNDVRMYEIMTSRLGKTPK